MTPSLGIEPGPHWWEASALTTAPSLHPKRVGKGKLTRHSKERLVSRRFERFRANWCSCLSFGIRSDEGLTLETSANKSFLRRSINLSQFSHNTLHVLTFLGFAASIYTELYQTKGSQGGLAVINRASAPL